MDNKNNKSNKSNKSNNMFIKAITITCLCVGLFSVIYITINSFIFVTATSTVENIPLSRTSEDLQFPSLLPIEHSQIQGSGSLIEDEATTDELDLSDSRECTVAVFREHENEIQLP